MFAVFAEDPSDYKTIAKLIRRIAGDDRLKIHGKGFNGGSDLLKEGAKAVRAIGKLPGIRKFVICHDADSNCGIARAREINDKIINPSGLDVAKSVALVPIAELESWILADLDACTAVFKAMQAQREIGNPENILDAKEHLARICRERTVPKYSNATHNPLIAEHLDLQKVYKKCPSFRPLVDNVDAALGKQRPPRYWSR